jgi:glycosyltransferase involved in cell wall biosynthesis
MQKKKLSNTKNSTTLFKDKPRISVDVVIAAKNEARYIGLCIDSVLGQVSEQYELKANIIVVDNGSTDETAEIAGAKGAKVYRKPDLSLAGVRNFGVAQGTGEYIAFIDADCSARSDWLEVAVSLLKVGHAGAVGGPCDVPENSNLIERAWNTPPDVELYVEADELATSSFITKRSTFEEVGGFDPELGAGEDTEFSLKIKDNIGKLLSVGKCKVIHYGYPKTLMQFIRREYWHGIWDAKRARGRSKILIVSYGFGFFLALSLVAAYFSLPLAFLIFCIAMGIPTALSLKKLQKARFQKSAAEGAMLMVLQSLYLVTRSFAGIRAIACN